MEVKLTEEEEAGRREMANSSENKIKDALTHFGFYSLDVTYKLDKDYVVCKNCLVKVKYTGNTTNMQSHLNYHSPELVIDQMAIRSNSKMNALFKAKLPFLSLRAASITKSIAGFIPPPIQCNRK